MQLTLRRLPFSALCISTPSAIVMVFCNWSCTRQIGTQTFAGLSLIYEFQLRICADLEEEKLP